MFGWTQARSTPRGARGRHRAFDCLNRTVRRAVDDGGLTGDPLTLRALLGRARTLV